MYILNLLDNTKSDIPHTIVKFPDGQQLFKLSDEYDFSYLKSSEVRIIISLSDFRSIEVLMGVVSSLRELRVKNISLLITYFLGARSDKKFTKNGYNYVKTVISPIINSIEADLVYVVDPHSDVIEGCINNFIPITQDEIIEYNIDFIQDLTKNSQLVSPDIGGFKKIFKIGERLGKLNIANGRKIRNTDGKITHIEIDNLVESESYFIVDDICDGGRTIVELSKIIKDKYPTSKVFVYITHGIFSKGFDVFPNVDLFMTTNSFKDIGEVDGFKTIHYF